MKIDDCICIWTKGKIILVVGMYEYILQRFSDVSSRGKNTRCKIPFIASFRRRGTEIFGAFYFSLWHVCFRHFSRKEGTRDEEEKKGKLKKVNFVLESFFPPEQYYRKTLDYK